MKLAPQQFLLLKDEVPVLDVRSPGEYAHGHIPGAISFPLFSDEERAVVGTAYKQQGRDIAFELGLRFVGPKMEDFVKSARKIARDGRLGVHCWRGGQRSGAMAWLLRQAGLDVQTLDGGYKAYRQCVLDGFGEADLQIVIVGGSTGSGKTKILHALKNAGEQIIDLEGIAHHKGSAFGYIGELPQPTVEQFENNLYEAIRNTSPARKVWLENESRSIGRVYIPDTFWAKMKKAPLMNVRVPLEARVNNLLEDYVLTDKADLEIAFRRIEKKLGGLKLKQAIEFLEQGEYEPAARIALEYYDKTYQYGLETNASPDIRMLEFDHGDPLKIAEALIESK